MPDNVSSGTNGLVPTYYAKMAAQEAGQASSADDSLVPDYVKNEQGGDGGGSANNSMIPNYVNNVSNTGNVLSQTASQSATVDNAAITQSYQNLAGRAPTDFEVQLADAALSGGKSVQQWQQQTFGGPVTVTSSAGSLNFSGNTLANAPGAASTPGDPYSEATGAASQGTKTSGAIVTEAADGTRVEQYANGVTATTTADGTTVVQDPNTHTTAIYTANGYTIAAQRRQFTDTNGQTQYYWDSTVTDPKGKTDIVWGDPHVIAANGNRFDFQSPSARLANFPGGTVDVTTKAYTNGNRVQDTLTVNVPGLTLTMQAGGLSTVSVNSGAETIAQNDANGQTTASFQSGIGYYDATAKAPDPQNVLESNLVADSAQQALSIRQNTLAEVGATVASTLSGAWSKVVDSVKGVLDGTGLTGS